MPKILSEISNYYNSGVEAKRLFQGEFQLERVRTQELIFRFLNQRKLKILDVGGGTGFYSFWLKKLGHQVHLIDPVERNLELARTQQKKKSKLDSIILADACNLPFENNTFDMVLMLGPLYHLTLKKERLMALKEVKRILNKNGKVIAVGITRYASLFEGYFHGALKSESFVPMMSQDLKNGQHRNKTGRFDYFTTAYFHHPKELREEIDDAGFKSSELLAVESFGWLIPNFKNVWKNASKRKFLLNTIRKTESDASLMALSAHLMAVGIK